MTQEAFTLFENYMLGEMGDSAHDAEHVYRVLYSALDIASAEPETDYDVLIAACLLHDVGRAAQFKNPKLCHAQEGSRMAYDFLTAHDFPEPFAAHVRDCIRTHRFRSGDQPQSIEAKILFDADKLDVSGAVGVARTFLYEGHVGTSIYTRAADGTISDGTQSDAPSFFHEYKRKLEGIYDKFYTVRGAALAAARQKTAADFYDALLREVKEPETFGRSMLKNVLK